MDTKQEIYNYLQTQILMGLSTFGDSNSLPWPAIVYFIVDEDLNLYFISSKKAKHCQNIYENPKVTCTVFDSSQKNAGGKIGIQYSGQAEEVNSKEKVEWMIERWNHHIAGKDGWRPAPTELLGEGTSRVYQVAPVKIKFFNTKEFKKGPKVWES